MPAKFNVVFERDAIELGVLEIEAESQEEAAKKAVLIPLGDVHEKATWVHQKLGAPYLRRVVPKGAKQADDTQAKS